MNKETAKAILKSINRHVAKIGAFEGGKQYGVDFNTWNVCYPQMAATFTAAAEVVTGRKGRFMPRF